MPAFKPRRTKVRKEAFFDPRQDCWKYLPVDVTVRQEIQQLDEDEVDGGDPMFRPLYEASEEKALVPMRYASAEQLAKLPTNWQEIAYTPGGAISPKPVFGQRAEQPQPTAAGK